MKVLEMTYLEEHGDEILGARGWTKVAFAKKLGISPQNVKKWLGTTDICNLSKIADVLDVSLEYLIYGERPVKANVQGYLEINGSVKKISSIKDFLTQLEK